MKMFIPPKENKRVPIGTSEFKGKEHPETHFDIFISFDISGRALA
jgi:hypothetical protein